MAVTADRLPVIVLTGYLGSGKTTLLNRILTEDRSKRYGVIVNEFGEIGIDADLVEGADEELIEMTNGCVCCTVRGDLIRTARALLAGRRHIDTLVVETTGLARPGPVAQSFLLDATLAEHTVLDSITTMVDARNIRARLADSAEAAEQVAVADQIVLNKLDLVSNDERAAVEAAMRALNPTAPVHPAVRANTALDSILDRGGFDLARLDAVPRNDADHDHGHEHGHDHDHGHDHLSDIESVSLRSAAPMDAGRLEAWLGDLLAEQGEDVLRAKGVISLAGEDRRLAVQAVHTLFEGELGRPWRQGDRRESRFVFIGRRLDEAALRAGFESCAAA